MNKEDIRRLQIMELVLVQVKESNLINIINESFKNEVGEDLNLKVEEIDEMLDIIKESL